MGPLNASIAAILTASLCVLSSGAAAAGQKPASTDTSRKHWAYPRGVIVTATIPSVSKFKDSAVKADLTRVAKQIEPDFEDCIADLRERRPGLRGGARVSLSLLITFRANGSVESVESERRPLPELVECTAFAMVQAQQFKIPPLPPTSKTHKPTTIRLVLDGVLLTDDEAKGKGYRYLESQRGWEASLKAHPEWLRCAKNVECTIVTDECQAYAVHAGHVQAFKKALAARQNRTCPDGARSTGRAVCVRSMCRVQR